MKRHRPEGRQSENWLLDPEYHRERVGAYSALDLSALVDNVEPLWIDGSSTYSGQDDRVLLGAAVEVRTSLRLIRVDERVLKAFAPGEAFGNPKRRVQGQFVHCGRPYHLWVTDPTYERRYLSKLDGTYRIGECHLTISLGEPFEGAICKLIAAVIEPDR